MLVTAAALAFVADSIQDELGLREALVELAQSINGLGAGSVGETGERLVVWMTFVLSRSQEGTNYGYEAAVELEQNLGERGVGNCYVIVSQGVEVGVAKARTIALCEAFASLLVAVIILTLDVDRPLSERVAEAQLVA